MVLKGQEILSKFCFREQKENACASSKQMPNYHFLKPITLCRAYDNLGQYNMYFPIADGHSIHMITIFP